VSDHTQVLRLAQLRQEELAAEQRRLTRLLGRYRVFSHVAVLLGIVVPVLAGSELANPTSALLNYQLAGLSGRLMLAMAVLATAMLTALHKGLNCEAYHAGCLRAVNTLQSLVEGYEAVGASHDPAAAVAALEARLREFRETAFDVPPLRQNHRAALAPAPMTRS